MTGPMVDELERARLRGKRAALSAVIVVSMTFIASSAVQIIPAVFGVGVRALPPAAPDLACAQGIARLTAALDRANDRAASPPSARENATRAFQHELSPEWTDAARIAGDCARSPDGLDAWASLLRLREAEEQLAHYATIELDPLRHDVAAHLPPDLR